MNHKEKVNKVVDNIMEASDLHTIYNYAKNWLYYYYGNPKNKEELEFKYDAILELEDDEK